MYNAADSDCTIRLYYIFKELLKKEELLTIHDLILMPLQYVLTETEYDGVYIDRNYLEVYSKELQEQIADLEHRIKNTKEVIETEKILNHVEVKNKETGEREEVDLSPDDKKYKQFNIQSTKDLQLLLFTVAHLRPIKKTKTGYSTDVFTMEVLAKSSELVQLILVISV